MRTMMRRWWTYQKERFPVIKHGLLILVFALGALCHSSLLRGVTELPSIKSSLVAFANVFIFFAMLRIADEFKDFEEDSRYRPYRPVPRGLVTLRELGYLGVAGAVVQLGLNLWLDSVAVLFLLIGWFYLALMTKEFFVPAWLKARPVAYMCSHMVIIPLMVLTAVACDWVSAAQFQIPPQIGYFLGVSLFSGFVLEVGRKIRAPQDEETGVDTYSHLWGLKRALTSLMYLLVAGGVFAILAANAIGFALPIAVLIAFMLAWGGYSARGMMRAPSEKTSKRIENFSGYWVLALYFGLGIVPMLLQQ